VKTLEQAGIKLTNP